MSGSYCFECGQSDADLDVPVGAFARDFLSESLDLDSRLRRTLGPLFLRPGAVPAAFVAGHRARFVPPVRLYVFASFAMFLLISMGSSPLQVTEGRGGQLSADADVEVSTPAVIDGDEPALDEPGPNTTAPDATPDAEDVPVSFGQRISEGIARVNENPEEATQDFLNRMAQAMFFLLPAFALMLKVLYRDRLYTHHLVFSIYLHSFAFMLVAVTALPAAFGLDNIARFFDFVLLWVPVYLFVALRRFYGGSRLKTFFTWSVLGLGYSTLGAFTMLALIFVTILWG